MDNIQETTETSNSPLSGMISLHNVQGESGNKLYAVTFVDTGDSEDTYLQLWRATDEEDLYKKVKLDFLGVDSLDEDDSFPPESDFNSLWAYGILCNEIGEIQEV